MNKPENNRKHVKAYVARQKVLGNCIMCGKKAVNKLHCNKHRLMVNEYRRYRYFKLKKDINLEDTQQDKEI
jgi:hypothetical protein